MNIESSCLVLSNCQFKWWKFTLNYDLFTDSENIWRGGTEMKDDDKFYDSRRTKAVNKLILLWREGRPREIQRISNATIKPPKCSLSILTTWWRHHWMHERERRERETQLSGLFNIATTYIQECRKNQYHLYEVNNFYQQSVHYNYSYIYIYC